MENEKFGERRRIKVYFSEGKISRSVCAQTSNNLLLCQERVTEKEKKKTIIFKT